MFSIKKEKMSKIIVSIYLFLAFFLPNICSIQTKYIIFFINILICLGAIITSNHIKFNRCFFKIFLGYIPFISFVLMNGMIKIMIDPQNISAYSSNVRGTFIIISYIIIYALAFNCIYNHYSLNFKVLLECFAYASLIQLFFVLLCFFIPEFKAFCNNLTIVYSDDEVIKEAIRNSFKNRAYGLTNNPFDGFGYIISFLISLTFVLGMLLLATQNTKNCHAKYKK